MKVTPVHSPHAVAPVQQNPQAAASAKARAVAMLTQQAPTQGQQQEHPVQNPSQVSVEELSAINRPIAPVADTHQDAQGDEQIADPTPEAPKPQEDPALSRQFAQLARQERTLRAKEQQKQQEWKAKDAELTAREAAIQPSKPDLTNYISVDQLKRDAYGTLVKHGISYDEVSQQALTHQPVNPQVQAHIEALEAKLAKLESLTETSQKTYQEQQQAQYQAAVHQIETDVVQLVKADPSTYEVIAKTGKGAIKEVVKLVVDTFNKDGILMSVEEAAQEVEDFMTERSFKTLSQIDKIKKRMAEASATTKQSDVKQQTQPKQTQMKTLTNAVGSTRQLTVRERAIAAMEGRLK